MARPRRPPPCCVVNQAHHAGTRAAPPDDPPIDPWPSALAPPGLIDLRWLGKCRSQVSLAWPTLIFHIQRCSCVIEEVQQSLIVYLTSSWASSQARCTLSTWDWSSSRKRLLTMLHNCTGGLPTRTRHMKNTLRSRQTLSTATVLQLWYPGVMVPTQASSRTTASWQFSTATVSCLLLPSRWHQLHVLWQTSRAALTRLSSVSALSSGRETKV